MIKLCIHWPLKNNWMSKQDEILAVAKKHHGTLSNSGANFVTALREMEFSFTIEKNAVAFKNKVKDLNIDGLKFD